MSEWNTIALDKMAEEITVGFVGPMASEYIEQGIPFLRSQNVIPFLINYNGIKYITEKFHKKLSKSSLKPGDVVIVRTGKPGASAVIPNSLTVANCSDLVIVRCGSKLDPNFVSYFINSITKSHIDANLVGAVQQHFNVGAAKQILIPDIDIAHQCAISTILCSLDDKIDLLHRQNATFEAMAETLFRQCFVEEAKEEWDTKQLKEVTDIGIGRTPPRKEFHWFSTNPIDVKWISIKDMGADGVFVSNTTEFLTRKAIKTFNIPVIPKHTVVLSFKMTVGRVAITTEEMLSNEAIAHFKFNKNTPFTKEYLFLFLKTFKYEILGSTSSIVTSINSAMIKDLEIKIPDAQTMNEFKGITEPIFNKINQNQTQIRTLTTLRDNLLPKLMSGEVRIIEQ